MQVCNQNDGQELKNDTCVYVDNYVEIGDFFLKEGVMLFFCKKNVKAFCNFDVKKQVKP